jgi:hypothetical protein
MGFEENEKNMRFLVKELIKTFGTSKIQRVLKETYGHIISGGSHCKA